MDIKKVFEQIEDKFDRLFNATVKFTKCAARNDDSNPRYFRNHGILFVQHNSQFDYMDSKNKIEIPPKGNMYVDIFYNTFEGYHYANENVTGWLSNLGYTSPDIGHAFHSNLKTVVDKTCFHAPVYYHVEKGKEHVLTLDKTRGSKLVGSFVSTFANSVNHFLDGNEWVAADVLGVMLCNFRKQIEVEVKRYNDFLNFRSYDIWVCENGHDEEEAIKYSGVLESDIELAMKEIRSEMIEQVYCVFPFTSKFNSIVKAVEDFADKNEMTEKQGRDKINEIVAEQLVTTLDIELEKIVNSRIEDPFDYDEPYRVFFTFEKYVGDSDIWVRYETYYFIFVENGTIERSEIYQLSDSNDFADRVANNCIEIIGKLID